MEIETKIKTDKLKSIKKKLINFGATFKKTVTQIDNYFKLKGKEMETQKPGSYILRIRKQEDKSSFTLKGLTDTTGAWLEYETQISNPEEMKKILEKIGFKKVFTIHKKRICGELNKFEINLDKVKELGNFVEFEIIAEDAKKGKEEINKLLKKLKISKDKIEHRGYAAIISQNMGVKFEGTNG